MNEDTKKSFDFALEAIKQLISLATAVLVFTTTFIEKLLAKPNNISTWSMLTGAWVLLLLSILAGIWSLFRITTALSDIQGLFEPSVRTKRIAYPVVVQVIAFVGALALFVAYVAYFAFHGLPS